MSILPVILYLIKQVSNVIVGFLYILPDLKATYGGQLCLRMTREFEPVKVRANVEVPPQGSHVISPPVHFFHKEVVFCHSVMSVKDRGI